jgi:AAA domain
MLAGWAQQVGIPGHRLLLVNLRGRRNPLGHPDDRARLVELLHEHKVEALLVDPFGRAYTGKSQNDAGEVTAFLADLDQFATDAGIAEVVLSVHAGWDGEHSRGSSALEDWADVVVTLARDPDDETARYLRAFGRDVEVDEDRLVFEPDTRTLTLAGAGSRKRSKVERAVEAAMPLVFDHVAGNPGCSGEDLRRGVDGSHTAIDEARRRHVQQGTIIEDPRAGRGGGKCYRVPAEPDKP